MQPRGHATRRVRDGLTTLGIAFGLAAILQGCAAPSGVRAPAIPGLIRVPLTRQATDHTCGVAALQSVLAYYGDEAREDVLAQELGTTDDGTAMERIAGGARARGYEVQTIFDASLAELQSALDRGKPAIVALQAWSDAPVDYRDDWDDGHWAVAIGYDSERIYFMDPSTLGTYAQIPVREFLDRWHDTDTDGTTLRHFMMVVAKPRPAYRPDAVVKME